MAPIVWADVTGFFPNDTALAAVSPAAEALILDRVNTELAATFFGGENAPKLRLARIYFAAHIASSTPSAAGSGAAGPLIAESEGGASRSYAIASVSLTGSHSLTGYGQSFDELVRSSPSRIGLVS